jgi:hypothetical protein
MRLRELLPITRTVWVFTTVVSAAAVFSAAQNVPPPDPPAVRILNRSCMSCHDLRPIETTALDKEGWTKVVNAMVERGADVKGDDVGILVNHLVENHGPLPDGPGKSIMLNVCTQCHTLDRIRARGMSREEWEELLLHMLNEGAELTDEELPVLLNYLTRNFRP